MPAKFLVLCSFTIRGQWLDPAPVFDELEAAGFRRIDSEPTGDGLHFGLPDAALGEFRSAGAEVLLSRLRKELHQRFAARCLAVEFDLCLHATGAEASGYAGRRTGG